MHEAGELLEETEAQFSLYGDLCGLRSCGSLLVDKRLKSFFMVACASSCKYCCACEMPDRLDTNSDVRGS